MSDRTYVSVQVLAWPEDPDQINAIRSMLAGLGLVASDVDIDYGLAYGASDDQVCCGAIGEHVVPALKAAPDATVKAYESPAYDWLGDLAWSAPGLGVYQQNCDDSGHPVFYASEVAAMVASAVAGTDETDALTGRPWLRAFASLEKAAR